MKVIMAALVAAMSAVAQEQALMPAREARALYTRALELMDAATVAIPGLSRAGAPLMEAVRQSADALDRPGTQQTVLTYTLLANMKAFLALTDSMPKPFPFAATARQQLAEFRDAAVRVDSHFAALLAQRETQVRSADRDNLNRYAEANARAGPPTPGKPRVVFLGDSITDGWRLNEYFPDRDFVNRGISGQITGEMLGRVKADVIDLKPDAVLLLGGTNDLARGIPVTTIQNNITMIADLAVANKIKPIFASVLPVSDYQKGVNPAFERTPTRPPHVIRALNGWLENFCANRGFTHVDYYSALSDGAGMLKAELADDGLHPNPMGYRVMAPIALAAIDRTVPLTPTPAEKPKRRRFPFMR